MQAFGEYMNDETASAMKARDYKDATDLVAEKKSHWDGSEVHPTLNQSFNTGAIGYSNQELFSQGGSGLVQAIPIHDQATRNAGKRGDRQDGKGNGLGVGKPGDPAPTLTKGDKHAIAFQTSELRLTGKLTEQSVCPTLKANTKAGDTEVKVVLYENHPNDSRVTGPHDVAPSCVSRYGTGGVINPVDRMAVRRLTPKECERLQGFPDDHTLIPWRNKPADQCPDGPRYKALGNSMAVPCMAWIGKRIDAIERNNRKDGQ